VGSAIAIVILLVLAAVASAQGDPIQQGAKLYAANCAVCHATRAKGEWARGCRTFQALIRSVRQGRGRQRRARQQNARVEPSEKWAADRC